jgi:hypothetical protein
MKRAFFVPDGHGKYLPANKAATAAGVIISKMYLTEIDLITIRSKGFIPCLTNGQEIGKVDVLV